MDVPAMLGGMAMLGGGHIHSGCRHTHQCHFSRKFRMRMIATVVLQWSRAGYVPLEIAIVVVPGETVMASLGAWCKRL